MPAAASAGGETKVTQLVGPPAGGVNVVWLHIHVHDAPRMQVLQRLGNLYSTQTASPFAHGSAQ